MNRPLRSYGHIRMAPSYPNGANTRGEGFVSRRDAACSDLELSRTPALKYAAQTKQSRRTLVLVICGLTLVVAIAAAVGTRKFPGSQELLHRLSIHTGVQLRLAGAGLAGESCSSNDGSAVQLTFQYVQNSADPLQGSTLILAEVLRTPLQPAPTAQVAEANVIAERWAAEELRRTLLAREFNVRINSQIDVVKALGTWDTVGDISRIDLPPSFSAWVYPTVQGLADGATAGEVIITQASPTDLEGHIDVVLESGRWVNESFTARLVPRRTGPMCG